MEKDFENVTQRVDLFIRELDTCELTVQSEKCETCKIRLTQADVGLNISLHDKNGKFLKLITFITTDIDNADYELE